MSTIQLLFIICPYSLDFEILKMLLYGAILSELRTEIIKDTCWVLRMLEARYEGQPRWVNEGLFKRSDMLIVIDYIVHCNSVLDFTNVDCLELAISGQWPWSFFAE